MRKIDGWDNKIQPDDVVMFLINKAYEAAERRHEDDLECSKFLNDQKLKDIYFGAALEIVDEFTIRQSTLEKILNDYLKRLEKSLPHITDFRLPPRQTMLMFVKLGVSNGVTEKLLKCFTNKGYIGAVVELARVLKRPLVKDEVSTLVEHYGKSAIQSDETEKYLINLAEIDLSEEDASEVKQLIERRRRDWGHHID